MTLFLKNLLFTVLVPGAVAGWLPWLIVQERSPHGGASAPASAILFAVGVSIYLWCVWDFAAFGRGTPAPIDAPTRLVVRGLYRYSRNPMYVGVLTTILAWATLYRAPVLVAYAACIGAVFHAFVMLYEEPHLLRTFGGSYDRYRAQVGRWLPGTGRRTAD